MNVNKERKSKFGRLPLIIIQSPNEVETSILNYTADDSGQEFSKSSGQFFDSFSADDFNAKSSSFASSCADSGIVWSNSTSNRTQTSQSVNSTEPSIDRSKMSKSKRPSSHAKLFKSRPKKANDLKYNVEDALLKFKKMKLNTDEDDAMEFHSGCEKNCDQEVPMFND